MLHRVGLGRMVAQAQVALEPDQSRRSRHVARRMRHCLSRARDLELGGLVADAAPIDALEAAYQEAAALQELPVAEDLIPRTPSASAPQGGVTAWGGPASAP